MVWSNPRVQELSRNFVAVADELHNLRTGSTTEAEYFQSVFRQKNRHPGHQGVFVTTPSGRLLASTTTYKANQVVDALTGALEQWNGLTPRERLEPKSSLVDHSSAGRPEDHYPDDGLVLRVTARDLPESDLTAERNPRWHRYYLWFNRDEVRSMVPKAWTAGQRHSIPEHLATRIAALALLDKGQVDGFTKPWRDADVEFANLDFVVEDLNESHVSLRIVGNTATRTKDGQAFVTNMPRHDKIPAHRGVRTSIVGRAMFDRKLNQFIDFSAAAVGIRFGGAYVGRAPEDWNEHPIGFSLVLGLDTNAEKIAPEFPHRYAWLNRQQ